MLLMNILFLLRCYLFHSHYIHFLSAFPGFSKGYCLTIILTQEELSSTNFPAISWCPISFWKPGTIVRTESSTIYVGNVPHGLAHVGFALLTFNVPLGTGEAVLSSVPLHIVNAPENVSVIQGRNTVQVDSIDVS